MCIVVIGTGLAIGFGSIGNLTAVERIIMAAICLAMAVFSFFCVMINAKKYAIQISGVGQIRLTVLQKGGEIKTSFSEDELIAGEHGELVHLLPISTLWSWLLILHLQHEHGRKNVLMILPDSLTADSYRGLLVACRWIVMRRADIAEKSTSSLNY